MVRTRGVFGLTPLGAWGTFTVTHDITDLNHAVKRDPRTSLRSPNTNWDFWTSLPEPLLQVTITMSGRSIPLSFRYMPGFSLRAYSFINAEGVCIWVTFHFRSQQGVASPTDQEAATAEHLLVTNI